MIGSLLIIVGMLVFFFALGVFFYMSHYQDKKPEPPLKDFTPHWEKQPQISPPQNYTIYILSDDLAEPYEGVARLFFGAWHDEKKAIAEEKKILDK
jgi:hypothetical protein